MCVIPGEIDVYIYNIGNIHIYIHMAQHVLFPGTNPTSGYHFLTHTRDFVISSGKFVPLTTGHVPFVNLT
mgnify:CR=1 FL=1